jgi:DNA uptake protein ComE-like DNA-binding protein
MGFTPRLSHEEEKRGRASSRVRTSGLARFARGPTYEKQSLKVNINSATQRELETLPGIGPAGAQSIIAHRPYQSVDDLIDKNVLGKKIVEELRPFVKTDGATEELKK